MILHVFVVEEITRELVQKIVSETITSSSPVDTFWQTVGVIVSVLVLAFSIYQFGRNQKQHYKEQDLAQKQFNETSEKAQKLEFMKQLEHYDYELSVLRDNLYASSMKYSDCHHYSDEFIGVLDRLSFLKLRNIVDDEFIQYYINAFNAGRTYFAWIKFTHHGPGTIEGNYEHYLKISKSLKYDNEKLIESAFYYYVNQINKDKAYLPKIDETDPKSYHETYADIDLLKLE